MEARKLEFNVGLRMLKRLVEEERELLYVTVKAVPGEKPWKYVKLPVVVFWLITLAPVVIELDTGKTPCSI